MRKLHHLLQNRHNQLPQILREIYVMAIWLVRHRPLRLQTPVGLVHKMSDLGDR
ncbi:protein of unknown function [Pseudorhizobium banfieldiae]|uniref:Uncharacterized protein n=1 Tax=Pseudorhizobium banfieldiae TaxID=1125847 RepID=L0NF76_9HYPH|nr:protein of unknown function [Pseudorhizobium banfieldiae]